MKHQDTVPFPDELEHLDHTLKIIDTALKKAGEDVLRLDQAYRDAKRYMAEYRNEMDRHEILQNEWALNQTDRTGAFAVEVREKLEKLKDTPYFARIDFVPDGEEEADTYYIGRFGFTHCNEKLIFDWRAPVSGIFYDYETSRAGFEAPVGRIEGELTRKRQFKIQNGTMEYAIESSANVQDEILQKELAHTSDEKMKSMISTIQREQNVIIRNERANTLIIQGVAGSGKTSIALHRIAFLLYRFKHQITAEDVMILSPNQVFADYISGVIPELGEEPVCERSLPDIAGDVREFLCSLMGKWEEVPKANVILKSLNKRLMIRDMLALYQDFYQYTDKKDMFVLSEENTLEWEDVFPFLYLMAAYEGIEENRSVKHLVIDEMQDYTPIQFAVLNMMYPCQKTILGDFGQILNPCHLHSLDEIRRIYKDAEFVALNKSYRSTYEIMEYAKKVCAQPSLEMVERHGERPGSIYCENVDHEIASITARIRQFEEGENVSLGIIVKTSADAKRLYNAISGEYAVHLLSKDSTRFTNGVSIASIRMAKGLEFDEVIVPDADDRNYHSDYDRNLLYIACTRAMHKLTLFYTGRPSPFLPEQRSDILI
ncbi:MAG: ATP-binding domain-containing protein [Dorea sp.]|uniref:HelD family protein n=1 Tax=Dorea sp. YH-dor226 TaxID=3151119 RepID=UPI0030325A47|nr:ATP-binding domain-containing protein [Dorea sp.]